MSTFKFKIHVSTFLVTCYFLLPSAHAGMETMLRLKNPFILPQLNLVLESSTENLTFKNKFDEETPINLNWGEVKRFGFELENNYNSFSNIGISLRWKYPKKDPEKLYFGALVGGFVRFFYVPSFLKYKNITGSLFSRIDLGAGPYFLIDSNGLLAQGNLSFGTEVFFSKWFGLGLSYSKFKTMGVDTIKENDRIHVSGSGSSVLFYLKSTYY